ncbi:MAG: ABC transporter permease subunit [Gammaproteobacteria bacterium]|nr:MAG: ABC transporter permease subunit [Gammaproteobacteria bacterium]
MALLARLESRGADGIGGRVARLTSAAGRRLIAGIPTGWLLLLFLVPFIIVFRISFSEVRLAIPPYTPLLTFRHGSPALELHWSAYQFLFTDPLYVSSYLYSLKVAAVSTLCCLAIGYPMAYAIAHAGSATRPVLLMLIVLPFWTSFLLRVYAWIGLLKNNGVINNLLMSLGVIHHPLALLQTDFAVYIGIVYSYLPFMILPLYANLEKHDAALLEAAADLGARPARAFLRITVPQSFPGIVAGSLLVFIPAVGEYVIPTLLGRTDQLVIGRVLSDEFFENRDWPVASAVAILILLLLVVPILLFQRYQRRELEGAR